MQNPLAHLEELLRSTERVLSAVPASDPEELHAVIANLRASFERCRNEEPIDSRDLPSESDRARSRELWNRLREATILCLDRALQEKDRVAETLQKAQAFRRFVGASQSMIVPPESSLSQDA